MAGKFKVGTEYRNNPLSDMASSIVVELHQKNGTTKVYDNIHNANAFINKAFDNLLVISATVKDLSDDSSKNILNHNL